jgi:S-adenosylmethionine-diacylglycerol 3-amino-3-carboxypropyl transferase
MTPDQEPFDKDGAAAPASWVVEAARRPVAFAQVREDAALDQWVVDQLEDGAEVLMVASGGCTAAALAATSKLSRLHLIDPNPAQLALARLKLRLLATAAPAERLTMLGHGAMAVAERKRRLEAELKALQLSANALGPLGLVAAVGPDQCGRYEALFAKLREAFSDVAAEITALLQLRNPPEQARRADPGTTLGAALDSAFDSVMALSNLVELFGEGATRNRCQPFARHFAGRTRHALASLPAADNPYLWQMLAGRFPEKVTYPWLHAPSPTRLPELAWTVSDMADALDGQTESFDFIHLSNILDWLTPAEAESLLERTWTALRPGGWTLIRQLNSTLNVAAVGGGFAWDDGPAAELLNRDRSFFYRQLHLGRKK